MNRAKLEELTENLIKRTENPVKLCLKDAGIDKSKVDEILLVGGMTRMPKVQSVVGNIFGKKPNQGVNPDEAVAIGAAI